MAAIDHPTLNSCVSGQSEIESHAKKFIQRQLTRKRRATIPSEMALRFDLQSDSSRGRRMRTGITVSLSSGEEESHGVRAAAFAEIVLARA
jgi:hypothetical protein